MKPSQALAADAGLLWRLVPRWVKVAIDDSVLSEADVAPVDQSRILAAQGKTIQLSEAEALQDSLEPYRAALDKVARPLFRLEHGPVRAFAARGAYGQSLLVIPEHRLVAARMYASSDEDKIPYEIVSFPEFENLVIGLVREAGSSH